MEKKGVMLPVVFAIMAGLIYWWLLNSKQNALNAQLERTTILVAKFDLPPRTVMNVDLVETREVPRVYLEQDAYEVRSQSDIKMVSNLVTAIRIPKGNQITQSALTSLSPEAGLSVKVPPGYRGCILPLDSEMLKLLKPSDHIDVLVTFDAVMGDNRKEKVTATILQNVLVLGVGADLGQGMSAQQLKAKQKAASADQAFSDKMGISLALNPNEAQYLALSQQQGTVSIVVRGLGDVELHPMEIASFKRLVK